MTNLKNKLKTKKLQKILFSLCFLFALFIYTFASSASIIDEIKSVFGLGSGNVNYTENNIETVKIIDDELETRVTGDER